MNSWLSLLLEKHLAPHLTLKVYDRHLGRVVDEPVFSELFMRWVYGDSWLGTLAERSFFQTKLFAKLYGSLQDRKKSREKISSFCSQHGISREDFESIEYSSFNEFFIRKFKPGIREFSTNPHRLAAPCEGRILAVPDLSQSHQIPVKGQNLNLTELCGKFPDSVSHNSFFRSQTHSALIFRLAPRDYHRFHFPLTGHSRETWRVSGKLRSVHPYSLKKPAQKDVYLKNERQITWIQSEDEIPFLMIEVGAMTVGKMIQSYSSSSFQKGQEKGYFLFGGSTVILVFESRHLTIDSDLLQRSSSGMETLVRLGSEIGSLHPRTP